MRVKLLAIIGLLGTFSGVLLLQAQDAATSGIPPSDCPYFGSQREAYVTQALRAAGVRRPTGRPSLSSLTEQVALHAAGISGGGQTSDSNKTYPAGSIDSYIFADLHKNNITPAPATTDFEFIRRVTLDLTGRIPTPARVLTFVADTVPNKRANLIEELLASPQWVDKWTMYFGDLYQNTDNTPSTSCAGSLRAATRSTSGSTIPRQRQAVQPDGDGADHRGRGQYIQRRRGQLDHRWL